MTKVKSYFRFLRVDGCSQNVLKNVDKLWITFPFSVYTEALTK